MSRPRPITAVFAWPMVIFAIGLAGLIIALTGDGWRDAAAWAALTVPIAAAIGAMAKRRN